MNSGRGGVITDVLYSIGIAIETLLEGVSRTVGGASASAAKAIGDTGDKLSDALSPDKKK